MCSLRATTEDVCTDNNITQECERTPQNFEDLSRRDVRSLVFHFLYAAEAFEYQESLQSIIDNFNRGFDLNVPLDGEIFKTVNAIITNRDALEQTYEPYLANWRSERISVCTKLILLFGIWELKNTDTDARIIINEAIELAKCFAEEDAYRFVNGILDPVSKIFRKDTTTNTES
jgi:transcription antitermination protein NusB